MNVKVDKQENSKVIIEFTLSKEEFDNQLDIAFKKNAKYFKVPGFRNGKVPRAIVEKTYGEGVLYDSVIDNIADIEYKKAVEENNLEVVSKPELDVKQIGKDQDLIYTITVYVKPEATVKQYKGLEIKKIDVKVTDEDVEKALEEVRQKNARILTIEDKPLKNGDISTIDFKGFDDGKPFEGGSAENFELTIGSGQFIPGFEEQLIGMNIGDEKEIKVTFPEDYQAKDLASKEVTFKVKLNGIKAKDLPNLDDEFAKDVSEFETLKEYKEDLAKKVKEDKEHHAKHEKEHEVIQKLIENVEANIPDAMIEAQIDESLEQFKSNLSYQGITLEKYAEMMNTNIEDLRKQFRPSAESDVKLKLALEYIGKNENVEVTDEEIDTKIEDLAKQYGNDNSDSLKKNDNVRTYVKNELKQDKLISLIVDSSVEK